MFSMTVLPARTGIGFSLSKGQRLRVIDPEGGQVCDLVAVRRGEPSEWISNGRSFDYNGRIYLSAGDTLYSNKSRAMLKITHDDVGRHDFLYTACSEEMYRIQYGVEGHHPNCLENLAHALRHVGLPEHFVPTPFNIFQNVDIAADGKLTINAPLSRRGDAIELLAEMDLDVALSACSASDCNGGTTTPIAFEIRG